MASQVPVVGSWYQDAEEDLVFEVVAVDEHAATVEVQYLDGEVSEIDFDTWRQLLLLPAEAPEDWRSSYELSEEDSHDADEVYHPQDMNDPLSMVEPDTTFGMDEL